MMGDQQLTRQKLYLRLTRRGVAGWIAAMVAPWRGAASAEPEAAFDVVLTSDVMVRMRDGVRLATDVYRPARNGRPAPGLFPVILERTPYGKTEPSRSEISVADPSVKSRAEVARFFVSRGYVVIYQDCRGRYGSEGKFVKYLSDGADGYDTCAWIVAQPWCDGKIGTMGLSYAAHTQGALGCANPPGVAAMFLDSGGFANAYQGGIRQGGAFELKQVTWAYSAALESPEVPNDPLRLKAMKAVDIRAWFARMPWKKGQSPLSLAPEYEDYTFEQWRHGDFDAYWKQMGLYAEGFYGQFSDAPDGPHVVVVRSLSPHGDPELHRPVPRQTLSGAADPGAVDPRRPHPDLCRRCRLSEPAATVDGNLAPDFLTLRLRWFDCWLKGLDNGVVSRAAGENLRHGRRHPVERTPRAGWIMAGAGGPRRTGRSPTRFRRPSICTATVGCRWRPRRPTQPL